MENQTCGALSCPNPGYAYRCDSEKGHAGPHFDSRYYENWPRKITDTAEFREAHRQYAPWFNAEYQTGVLGDWQEKTVTLQLTLEDLKTIAYYMAEEEDGDKTKIKIDKALKEML